MVYPIPDTRLPSSNDTVQLNKKALRKRKKRSAKKFKKQSLQNKNRFVVSMSSWAEQFTAASTWQIKHQVAYWKSRAVSLEYENKILHDIIRQNCSDAPKSKPPSKQTDSEFDFQNGPVPKMYASSPETETSEESQEEDCDGDGGKWEVSEEFIQFLQNNAKFKEDARRERELLKKKLAGKSQVEIYEAGPSETENCSIEMKELYGANWQRVAALEMSVQSHFINESDKIKPCYWPNIPLNFG